MATKTPETAPAEKKLTKGANEAARPEIGVYYTVDYVKFHQPVRIAGTNTAESVLHNSGPRGDKYCMRMLTNGFLLCWMKGKPNIRTLVPVSNIEFMYPAEQ